MKMLCECSTDWLYFREFQVNTSLIIFFYTKLDCILVREHGATVSVLQHEVRSLAQSTERDERASWVGSWIQVDCVLIWFGTKVRIHGALATGQMHYVTVRDIYNPENKSRAASSDITRSSAASTKGPQYLSSTPALPSASLSARLPSPSPGQDSMSLP